MKSRLKLNFVRFGHPRFLAKSELIVTVLTEEPALSLFPEPWPAIFPTRSALFLAFSEYRAAAFAADEGNKQAILQRDQKRLELENLLKRVAAYFESVAIAANDVSMLEATGFDLVSPAARIPEPLQAPALTVKHGTLSGEVIANMKPIPGAASYEGQTATGDSSVEANYQTAIISPRSTRIRLGELTPGQRYHVRFRGIGSTGPGAWSDPVTIIAV